MKTIKHQHENSDVSGALFDAQVYEKSPTSTVQWEHADAMDVDLSLIPDTDPDRLISLCRWEYRGWTGVFTPTKKEVVIEFFSPSGYHSHTRTNSLSRKNAEAIFKENVDSLIQWRERASSSQGTGVWQIGQKVRLKLAEALKKPGDYWGREWLTVELDAPLILRRGRHSECKEFNPEVVTDHPFNCDCFSCWPESNDAVLPGDRSEQPEQAEQSKQLDEIQQRLDFLAEDTRIKIKRTAEDIFSVGLNLLEAKQLLPHGEFSNWVEREFNMSSRSALNFMRVAEAFQGKSANFADLNLSASVLYILAAPSTPESARDEILNLAVNEPIPVKRANNIIRSHRQELTNKQRDLGLGNWNQDQVLPSCDRPSDPPEEEVEPNPWSVKGQGEFSIEGKLIHWVYIPPAEERLPYLQLSGEVNDAKFDIVPVELKRLGTGSIEAFAKEVVQERVASSSKENLLNQPLEADPPLPVLTEVVSRAEELPDRLSNCTTIEDAIRYMQVISPRELWTEFLNLKEEKAVLQQRVWELQERVRELEEEFTEF